MKMNWGTGIVLSFVAFVLMIFYLVWKINRSSEHMVTDRPYEEGLAYNETLARKERSAVWQNQIVVEGGNGGICIRFPKQMQVAKAKGTVTFFRPQGDRKDIVVPLTLNAAAEQCVQLQAPANGRWRVAVDWQLNDTTYEWQRDVYVPS
jgi:nitrogen fixation protein FixH